MYQEAFEKVETKEAKAMLAELASLLVGVTFKAEDATIMQATPRFYPGYEFLDIGDYSNTPAQRRFAMYKPGESVVLDFTNAPIYTLNKTCPIKLDTDNVADYLRFFFTYVRGKHGRFIIVENVDDIPWRDDPPPAARKAIGNMLMPVTLHDIDDEGVFHLETCMLFKDSLFKSHAEITRDGFVSLRDEELLVEDMPVLDDTFGE